MEDSIIFLCKTIQDEWIIMPKNVFSLSTFVIFLNISPVKNWASDWERSLQLQKRKIRWVVLTKDKLRTFRALMKLICWSEKCFNILIHLIISMTYNTWCSKRKSLIIYRKTNRIIYARNSNILASI